jgi:hypothetical protein
MDTYMVNPVFFSLQSRITHTQDLAHYLLYRATPSLGNHEQGAYGWKG